MKRSAFTLIELIFVIVVLGILSAVAVVKMGQMANNAKLAKLIAFTGTLNRSVGPILWFDSREDSRGGSIALADYDTDFEKYTDIVPGYTSGPSLVNCNSDGNGTVFSYSYGDDYEIHCRDGNETASPDFTLYNLTDAKYME